MKPNLLPLLKCPKSNENLELMTTLSNQEEVVTGYLKSSQATYSIVDGVVNFIDPNNEYIKQEMLHNVSEMGRLKQSMTKSELDKYLYEQALGLNPANSYDEYTRNSMDEILGNLGLNNASILEIGGSTGRDLIKYFGNNNNNCVEMDINPFLGMASEIIMNHHKFYFERIMADMNELPFQDNKFDVVFGSATFHHIDNPVNTFRSIYRILKPGGVFYCLNERVLSTLRPELKEVIAKELEYAHEHAFFTSEWTSFLESAGFKVHQIRPKFFSYEKLIERVYGDRKPKRLLGKIRYNYYRFMKLINLSHNNLILRIIQKYEDKYFANVPFNAICRKI